MSAKEESAASKAFNWLKDKAKGAKDSAREAIQSKKRFVFQGIHHQLDDRICTFASKSNPDKPGAYKECVDTLMYNRYARKCEEAMADEDLDDQEKERKCMKYRWEYLVESLPMEKVPTRVPLPRLWEGVKDSDMIKYNPKTYQLDGPGIEDYELDSADEYVKRGSARRRGSSRKACGSRKVALRGSAKRGSCKKSVARRRGSCRK